MGVRDELEGRRDETRRDTLGSRVEARAKQQQTNDAAELRELRNAQITSQTCICNV